MPYTINFIQSPSELNKQVELIARYAHDPYIRYQPILVVHRTYSIDNIPPFPKNSFETKEMMCQGGQCIEHMYHAGVRILSINPYGF